MYLFFIIIVIGDDVVAFVGFFFLFFSSPFLSFLFDVSKTEKEEERAGAKGRKANKRIHLKQITNSKNKTHKIPKDETQIK